MFVKMLKLYILLLTVVVYSNVLTFSLIKLDFRDRLILYSIIPRNVLFCCGYLS